MAKYLLKRPSGYYLRFAVPRRFRPHLAVGEFRVALRTRLASEARHRAYAAASAARRKLEHLLPNGDNWMSLSSEEISRLVRNHVRETIEQTEDLHFGRRRPFTPDEHDGRLHVLASHEWDLREALGTGNLEPVVHLARGLLEEAGYPIDETSREFRRLCAELIHGCLEAVGHERELLFGHFTPKTEGLAGSLREPNGAEDSPAELFSTATEAFLDERVASGRMTANTRAGYEATFRDWIEIVGDTDLRAIRRSDVVRFRDYLAKLPKNRRKSAAYSATAVAKLLEMRIPPEHLPADRTIKEALGRIQAFTRWATQSQLMASNVADGVEKIAESESRQPYTDQDLQRIFEHKRYLGQGFSATYQYWLPLLGLYTGARLAELCQLYLDDLVLDDPVPHILVRPNKARGQRIKNKNAARTIPVHPALMRVGFLEYARELAARGQQKVFPDLTWGARSAGQHASKRFAEFLREVGVKRQGLTFHSFRNTVNTRLYSLEAGPAKIQQLLGHRKSALGESNTYLSQIAPAELRGTLEMLEFPVPLDRLAGTWRYLLGRLDLPAGANP
jgi:integrase